MTELFPLRPLQELALEGLRNSLRHGKKRPIIQAPTGFGKTVIGAHIVAGAMAKRKRVAFVVPMLNLIDQTFERFQENGIDPADMGVIQGNHPWRRPSAPIQICSVQTIGRRGYPEVDFVLVDEVHLRFQSVDDWIADQPTKIFVGLSATPWSRGLADHWDDLIIPTSISELIENKYLSAFRAFAPSHPDLSGVKIVAGDYAEGELSKRMQAPKLVADVVSTWIEKAQGLPTLVFAVDRAHAAVLHEQFEEAGITSAYVDANTPREDRAALAKEFQAGRIKVICSVGTMTTGVDLDVRCIVLARPTKSEILFVQMIGRGLRTADGKENCLILDHSDTHLRLGMVTDIHHDRLLSGKKADADDVDAKTRLPKDCPQCAYLVPVGASECPNCGFKPKRVCSVVAEEGELVELGMAAKLKRKNNGEMTWPEKERFFGELKGYRQEMAYKEGWAAAKYREKTGVWPNDPRVKYAPAISPSAATRSWIRAANIRWSKTKPRLTTDQIISNSMAGMNHA